MIELIKLVKGTNVTDSFLCWEELKKQNKEHVFNVDVNSIIRALHNQHFIPSEMGYLFYLASNPTGRIAVQGAVSLSARDINKIVKNIWREQMRQYRAQRRSGYFDGGIPF
ncbi:TPA: hypothetical protein JAF30_003460 [Salmonella enterica subsp. enterica serovar Typhimurium]|nr:hypothetical protein [Salmonella enterica]EHF8592069.1 hypothetical protein [Salmonella enterica]EHG4039445.1 hypothetical protein [Salmonella enterica]EHG6845930.1 hypothetical protein [Salmonella enterica]HAT5671039.1 hypothetical protein [Salmonella enterica subsp. enterica serovar Typhimurium]